MRALLRDPCNCQAELDGIARIVEVSFLSFKFVWYGEVWGEGGGTLWDLCQCYAELGDILLLCITS